MTEAGEATVCPNPPYGLSNLACSSQSSVVVIVVVYVLLVWVNLCHV